MDSTELVIETGRRRTTVDLTAEAASFCAGKETGCRCSPRHAGVAILEAGAGSDTDLLDAIDRLLPADPGRWRHEHGTPGHGRDHVLPAFIGPSLIVPVVDGSLGLGRWQSIVLVDTNVDNPTRRVRLSFMPA
jgi:thiamine phosphate synthase YjbQ (UPF0047 family)